jgi:hypothetical protein
MTTQWREQLDRVHERMVGVTEADILELLNVEVEHGKTGTILVEETRVFTWDVSSQSIQQHSASTPTLSSPA